MDGLSIWKADRLLISDCVVTLVWKCTHASSKERSMLSYATEHNLLRPVATFLPHHIENWSICSSASSMRLSWSLRPHPWVTCQPFPHSLEKMTQSFCISRNITVPRLPCNM